MSTSSAGKVLIIFAIGVFVLIPALMVWWVISSGKKREEMYNNECSENLKICETELKSHMDPIEFSTWQTKYGSLRSKGG